MFEWTTASGRRYFIDLFAIAAWIVLFVAVIRRDVWMAVLPLAYILAPHQPRG